MIRRRLATALLLVVAACGGGAAGEEAAFASDYRELATSFQVRLEGVAAQAPDAVEDSPEALRQVYADFLDVVVEVRPAYAELEPPEAYEAAVSRLVENLDRQSEVLEGVLTAAEADNLERLAAHLRSLSELLDEFGTINQLIVERLPPP